MSNQLFITSTKIIYLFTLLTCPYWLYHLGGKIIYIKDAIASTMCIASLFSAPFTIAYTLYRQFFRNDTSNSTALIPILPLFGFYTTIFIYKTLKKGPTRER